MGHYQVTQWNGMSVWVDGVWIVDRKLGGGIGEEEGGETGTCLQLESQR